MVFFDTRTTTALAPLDLGFSHFHQRNSHIEGDGLQYGEVDAALMEADKETI
jgi:hypothetical protein